MSLPIITIIGRPNVGKSTLFNRILGERKAIVEDLPGVTRDRNYALVERFSIPFYLVDTGGYEHNADDPLQKFVVEQTKIAMDEADVVFCMFDGEVGVHPGDEEMVTLLRGYGKKVVFIVNKVDGDEQDHRIIDFYSLGLGDFADVSAKYGRSVASLVEDTLTTLPDYGQRLKNVEENKKRKQREAEEAEHEIEMRLAQLPAEDPSDEFDEGEMSPEFEFEEDGEAGTSEPDFAPVFVPGENWESELDYIREHRIAPLKKIEGKEEDELQEQDQDEEENVPELELIKVAIVGRPNVGKSTLFNTLTGSDRSITSPLAGTTRDSIDTPLKRNGQDYLLVDTAGLRRKARITDKVERYSVLRALKSLTDADVAVLVIDAVDGPTEQDTKIAGLAHENGLGIVICVNKWDLVEKDHRTVKEFTDNVYDAFKFAKYAPIVFTSALSGRRCPRVVDLVKEVAIQRMRRVPTGKLNRVLQRAHQRTSAPTYRGKLLKFYFATQIASAPPRFAMFFNFNKGVHFSYLRSLKNSLRDEFGFVGTDIKIVVRKR